MSRYSIIAGPALHGEPSESAYAVIPGAPLAHAAERGARVRRRPRQAPEPDRSGEFVVLFTCPGAVRPLPEAGDASVPASGAGTQVAGVGVCDWSFTPPSEAAAATHVSLHGGGRAYRGAAPWGFIEYVVREIWELEEPWPEVNITLPVSDPLAPNALYQQVCNHHVKALGGSVSYVLAPYAEKAWAILLLGTSLFFEACLASSTVARSVRLGMRLAEASTVQGIPSVSAIRAWRRSANVTRAATMAPPAPPAAKTHDEILLELPAPAEQLEEGPPAKRRRGPGVVEMDPLHLINAAFFRGSFGVSEILRRR